MMLDLHEGILEIFAEAQHPVSLETRESKKSFYRLMRWHQTTRSNQYQRESIKKIESKCLRMKVAVKVRNWLAALPKPPKPVYRPPPPLPQPATHTEPRTPLFRMTRREHDQLIAKRRQNLSRVR